MLFWCNIIILLSPLLYMITNKLMLHQTPISAIYPTHRPPPQHFKLGIMCQTRIHSNNCCCCFYSLICLLIKLPPLSLLVFSSCKQLNNYVIRMLKCCNHVSKLSAACNQKQNTIYHGVTFMSTNLLRKHILPRLNVTKDIAEN